jgi:hypothetical protein
MVTPAGFKLQLFCDEKSMRCHAGAPRGRRSLRDAYWGFAVGLPMVGMKILMRNHPKGYTSHEVTALRAGGPAGRPCSLLKKCGFESVDTPLSESSGLGLLLSVVA